MKKHFSKAISCSLLVFVFIFSSFALSAMEKAPKEIYQAALEGVSQFIENAPFSGNSPFNGAGKDELKKATVKDGFQVFTVLPTGVVDDVNSSFSSMLRPTGVWRFIVSGEDKPLALVTVARVDGKWKTVSIGGAGLAGEINSIRKVWPKERGFSFRFVRVFQAKADFMEISSGKDVKGFAPLKSAKLSLEMDSVKLTPGTLLYESEIMEPLRAVISRELNRDVTKEK